MNNHPAPASHPSTPGPEYRLELNNRLQRRGWKARLTWDQDVSYGPGHNLTWRSVCRCPFHFSPYLVDSHLWLIVDGVEYGRGEGRTIDLAKEEAARLALRRLIFEEIRPFIERRSGPAAP